MNILSEVIIPLSGVVFPAVVAFIRAVYNRWGEGRKLHRDSQFDKVNVEKRLATFRRINQLKNKNDLTPFDLLAIKALYEGIGIRYPVTISHKILEYIASNNIDFNEPTLNSFLRMSRLLNVTNSGVTQPSSKRKKALGDSYFRRADDCRYHIRILYVGARRGSRNVRRGRGSLFCRFISCLPGDVYSDCQCRG